MRLSILILLLPLFGFSQQKILLDIDDECKRRIQNKINHGIAIATIDSLNKLEFLNYGTENDNGIKVSEKSIFEIASISKTFTSKFMHELVDNNVIQLQQEIRIKFHKQHHNNNIVFI